MTTPAYSQITAVILAGGKARRLDGEDKGMIKLLDRTLIDYIISALKPQVGKIIINANRNIEHYQSYGFPVIADMMGDYFGPLAGMATGMKNADTPYILAVPCDSPFIPSTLVSTMFNTLTENQAEICVAHDGNRMQPVFALISCKLLPSLLTYIDEGGRKIDNWYVTHKLALADLSDSPDTFMNLNTPADKIALETRMAEL